MQPWQGEGGCYAGQDRPRVAQDCAAPPAGALAGRDDRGGRMTAVAVVRLGAMGIRMAARLAAADHEVTVWKPPATPTTTLPCASRCDIWLGRPRPTPRPARTPAPPPRSAAGQPERPRAPQSPPRRGYYPARDSNPRQLPLRSLPSAGCHRVAVGRHHRPFGKSKGRIPNGRWLYRGRQPVSGRLRRCRGVLAHVTDQPGDVVGTSRRSGRR